MSNKRFFRMIVCAVLAIGLVLTGCENSTNSDGGGGNNLNNGGNNNNTGGNGYNNGGNNDNTGGNGYDNGGNDDNTGGNDNNTGGNDYNNGGNDDNTGGSAGDNGGGNSEDTGGNGPDETGNNGNTGGNGNDNTGGGTTATPDIPTGVKATALSSTKIQITWDAVSGATSYKIYSPEEAGSSSGFVELDTSTTNSYTNNDVQANQTWYYKVSAVNGAGESAQSLAVSTKTPASDESGGNSGGGGTTISKPGTPTNIKATVLSSTKIQITWNAVSGATSYKIYSPEEAGSSSGFVELDTSTTSSYTDAVVRPGQTWYYKVSAVNSAGESILSSYVYATTPSILGKWYTSQSAANSGTGTPTYEFLVNGELYLSGFYAGSFTENYSSSGMSGNTVTIESSGATLGTATFNLSGTSMTITNEGSSGLMNGTYYKKAN
jgi:hypothetical protein